MKPIFRKPFFIPLAGCGIAFCLAMSGCGGNTPAQSAPSMSAQSSSSTPTPSAPKAPEKAAPPVKETGTKTEERFFGSYEYPASWAHTPLPEKPDSWFYMPKDAELVKSNLVVLHGPSGYGSADADAFLASRLTYLEQQAFEGLKTERIETKQGYPTLDASYNRTSPDGRPVKVRELFIVGEFEFVAVLSSDLGDGVEPNAADAGRALADSLTWNAPEPDDSANWKQVETPAGSFEIPVTWAATDAYQDAGGGTVFLPEGADPEQPSSNFSVLKFETEYTVKEYNLFIADITKQLSAQMGVSKYRSEILDNDKHTVVTLAFDLPAPEGYTMEQTLYFLLADQQALQIAAVDLSDGTEPSLETIARRIVDTYKPA